MPRVTFVQPDGSRQTLEAPAGRTGMDVARDHGVRGMRERAAHFGGELVIDSAPGAGTVVRLVMPLAAASEESEP